MRGTSSPDDADITNPKLSEVALRLNVEIGLPSERLSDCSVERCDVVNILTDELCIEVAVKLLQLRSSNSESCRSGCAHRA